MEDKEKVIHASNQIHFLRSHLLQWNISIINGKESNERIVDLIANSIDKLWDLQQVLDKE